ncbi:MAG: hypothetical protein ACRCWY_03630 [Cellulosilyticaceae bacterium]
MLGSAIEMKGFMVENKYLIIAKQMKDAILVAVEKNIVHEAKFAIELMPKEMMETKFYRKIGDLNDVDAVKSLLTFYKDESISLKYNGEYILSEESVGGFIRSKEDDRAVLLCSTDTEANNDLGKDTWMKVDEHNPICNGEVLDVEKSMPTDQSMFTQQPVNQYQPVDNVIGWQR